MNNWLRYLQRMEDYRVHEEVWQYHSQGNRNVGRPMKRWSDPIYEPQRIQTLHYMEMFKMTVFCF
jgi:hypothetical protein